VTEGKARGREGVPEWDAGPRAALAKDGADLSLI